MSAKQFQSPQEVINRLNTTTLETDLDLSATTPGFWEALNKVQSEAPAELKAEAEGFEFNHKKYFYLDEVKITQWAKKYWGPNGFSFFILPGRFRDNFKVFNFVLSHKEHGYMRGFLESTPDRKGVQSENSIYTSMNRLIQQRLLNIGSGESDPDDPDQSDHPDLKTVSGKKVHPADPPETQTGKDRKDSTAKFVTEGQASLIYAKAMAYFGSKDKVAEWLLKENGIDNTRLFYESELSDVLDFLTI